MTTHKRQVNANLFEGLDFTLDTDQPSSANHRAMTVEHILIDLIRPDPIQARRVLPESIHLPFHEQNLTPSQALRQFIQVVQAQARDRGAPFTSVNDLLQERSDNVSHPSPEECTLLELVNLALTIRDNGQVNPITVIDVSEGIAPHYRIETGERRYWASWLLRDFISGIDFDGTIPCLIVPDNRQSVFRQAKENMARSGLSAIAMARQAALLLLCAHDFPIPDHPITSDFYRQALDLDLRGKREHTVVILEAMGGMTRQQFSRYKLLLRLSDEAMDLADRHQIDEGVLRPITTIPPPRHAEIVQQIITHNLTAKQVMALCTETSSAKEASNDRIPKHTQMVVKILRTAQAAQPDAIAQLLIKEEKDVELARARLQVFRRLLDETERILQH